MRVTFNLEAPHSLRANVVDTSPNTARLEWVNREDYRAHNEIDGYCRQQGESEWRRCFIADREAVTTEVTHVDEETSIPFEAGHTYEFVVQAYGPVFPAGSGDSDYSNIATVTF